MIRNLPSELYDESHDHARRSLFFEVVTRGTVYKGAPNRKAIAVDAPGSPGAATGAASTHGT